MFSQQKFNFKKFLNFIIKLQLLKIKLKLHQYFEIKTISNRFMLNVDYHKPNDLNAKTLFKLSFNVKIAKASQAVARQSQNIVPKKLKSRD